MRFHRVISVLTLAAFLPLAAGCVTRRTFEIESDPSALHQILSEDGRLEIDAYTLQDGRHFDWPGYVAPVGADSVLFTPRLVQSDVKPATLGTTRKGAAAGTEPFTLDVQGLRSVDVLEEDSMRTMMLVTGGVAAILVLVTTILVATDGAPMY